MKKYPVLMVCWLVPLLLLAQQREAVQLYQQAVEAAESGDPYVAIDALNRAVAINAGYLEAYQLRAQLYANRQRWDKAYSDYTIVLFMDSLNIPARMGRGLAALRTERYHRALDDLDFILNHPEKETSAIYYQLSDRGEGPATTGIFTMQGNKAEIYHLKGQVLKEMERWQEASDEYTRALAVREQAEWLVERGQIYEHLQHTALAIKDYKQALKLSPDNRQALFFLGELQPENITLYNRAIEYAPYDPAAWLQRGIINFNSGRLEAALSDFFKVVELDKANVDAWLYQGMIYQRWQNYSKALEVVNRSIKLDGSRSSAYSNRGNIFFKQGNYQEAIRNYLVALGLTPEKANVYYNLGLAYRETGEEKEACKSFRQAKALGLQRAKKVVASFCKEK
jgi:tetratricopeptide (TPR) repeat protein